jgi:diguanylate cyclase (GGDEF)-like protein
MPHAAEQVDLKVYAELARRMWPNTIGLGLCAPGGGIVNSSSPRVTGLGERLLRQTPDLLDTGEPGHWAEIDSKHRALCVSLALHEQHPAGNLLFFFSEQGDTEGHELNGQIYDALMPLTACIRHELELNVELDAMAGELSERYEELNLVYHTDDQVSFFREGEEALRNLIRNCSEYLNVEFAVLHMRDKGVTLTSNAVNDHLDAGVLFRYLDEGLYDRILADRSPLVINETDDALGALDQALPCRILGCPIPSTGNKIDGVLLIANSLAHPKFSNSDRNLLQVMAKKAAKIVQGSWDGLTGLVNRRSFEHAIEVALARSRRIKTQHVVLHINLDQLHRINDTLGHEAGDAVIERSARLIQDELREMDITARIGGDELGVLIHNCDCSRGKRIAEKLRETIATGRFEWRGEKLQPTVSIGLAKLRDTAGSVDQVLKHAVVACDLAKERGRDRVQVYEHDDTGLQERERNMWMVGTVLSALREDRLVLDGQLIKPLASAGSYHVEALLRMRQDDKFLLPNEFLPASERYQLMLQIDEWVLANALEIFAATAAASESGTVLSVNLSGQSFCEEAFLDKCISIIERSRVQPESICFEITETAAVANITQAQRFIKALRAMGATFALDDFGAGLSSFGYLKSFDVQYLKIDGALVRDIVEDPVSEAMVASINQIGHVMGHQTIAEYAETPAIETKLRGIGVDFAQGYAIGRPVPLRGLLEGLNTRSAAGAA